MADGKDTNNTGVGNATDGGGGNNMNTDNAANAGGGGGGQKGSGSSKPKKYTDRDKQYREQLKGNITYGDAALEWYKSISSSFGMDTVKKIETKNDDPDVQASNEKAKAEGINNVADLSFTLTTSLMQAANQAIEKAVKQALDTADKRYKKK
jgi:hypothetical protein